MHAGKAVRGLLSRSLPRLIREQLPAEISLGKKTGFGIVLGDIGSQQVFRDSSHECRFVHVID